MAGLAMVADGSLSEESIERLLRVFYERARRDPKLGPVFTRAIGTSDEEWASHLARVLDFWCSMMLCGGRRYQGNPFATHLRLPDLEPAMFDTWLALFCQSCNELFDPEVAALFEQRAARVARSLRMGIFERLPVLPNRTGATAQQ